MKKQRFLIILSLLFLSSCSLSINQTSDNITSTKPTTTLPSSTKPSTTLPSTITSTTIQDDFDGYYDSVNTNLTKDSFINQLTTIINKGYVKFSYSKDWEILEKSDADLNNPGYVTCLYTGRSMLIPTSGSTRNWNREHVWPNSHGFSNESYAAYTDAHHLRATETSINSIRGNLDFDEVENHSGTVKSDNYGNKWITNECFEPRDEVKGDVARMLFYMVTKYNDSSLDLTLVNEKTSPSTTKLGFFDTLIKWHYEDPVSATEIYRNEVVFSYQKNRNPYIDHPEYVSLAFDTSNIHLPVDNNKVNNVIKLINGLDGVDVKTEEKRILDVKTQYDLLNNVEKTYVTNYYKLASLLEELNKDDIVDEGDFVLIDFANSGLPASSSGYELNKTFTINNKTFFTTSYHNDVNGLKIGNNKNDFPLTKFGLSDLGSYLEEKFTTNNVKKLSVSLSKTSGTTKWYVYFTEENSTQCFLVNSGTDFTTIEAQLETKKNGHFTIVFTGTKARIWIDQYKIYIE